MEAAEARVIVRNFALQHPAYAVDAHPYPKQGGNSWVFKGAFRGVPAIFKVSNRCTAAREANALQRFAATGLVPRVLAVQGEVLLVTEFAEGATWLDVSLRGVGAETGLVASIAQASVRLIEGAHSAGPFDAGLLERNLDVTLQAARRMLKRNADLSAHGVFARTLEAVARHRDAICSERPCLHFDGLGVDTVMIRNGRFSRFIDLEMCWQGTLHLQVGAVVANLAGFHLPFDARGVVGAMYTPLSRAFHLDRDLLRATAWLKNWIRIVSPNGWREWDTRQAPPPDAARGGRLATAQFADRLIRTEMLLR